MRDPRLAEIDFLMDLEQSRQLGLSCTDHDSNTGVGYGDDRVRYGLDHDRFRAMVLDLLLKDLIVGFMPVTYRPGGGRDERDFHAERLDLTQDLLRGETIHVHLSHAGRVHLWNLRDALLRDPDTEPFGLRSRAAWDRDLFVRLRWASSEAPLSIMFLDLDNFGAINKQHGSPVGDAVLRLVFGLIKSTVGTRGAAYRYGGEEVGVLLPGVDIDEARSIAEDLRVAFERDVHREVPQLTAPQTASIGVAAFTGSMENDAAVSKVDELMRLAKRGGKNRIETAL